MNRDRRRAIMMWLGLWVVAAVIQFIHNEWLIVGFLGSLGMVIIYLKLENPEVLQDRKTGYFTQAAFVEYTRQYINSDTEFSLICMKYPPELYAGRDEIRLEIQTQVAEYFKKLRKVYAFQADFDEVILMTEDAEYADYLMQSLQERFFLPWDAKGEYILNPNWLYIPKTFFMWETGDLLYTVRYLLNSKVHFASSNILLVDEAVVEEVYQEKKVERLIVDALEHNRVDTFYQPIYSTEQGRFTTAEALVRIRDEDGRLVPPGIFIEVAEKKGLILQLGERVFENVCQFIQQENIEKYGLEYIEVNLSVVQCAYEKLAEVFIHYMKKYNVNPKQINLEITESASLTAKQNLVRNMEMLMDYGVRFSLDDFGTGQSNLNYIIEMPVDIVKFDRSMILSYFENGKAKYVMDAAMHMIHGMDLKIVSEGIETKEQFETMEYLGINYIQGYYFSKPLSRNDFIAFLKKVQP